MSNEGECERVELVILPRVWLEDWIGKGIHPFKPPTVCQGLCCVNKFPLIYSSQADTILTFVPSTKSSAWQEYSNENRMNANMDK